MSKILSIDTATDICTVTISDSGNILSFRDSGDDRSHSVKLATYIDQVLKDAQLKVSDLDAVAISMGPGSYTGLRIGVSTAKGLCYGANIPLISVSTLHAMCYGVSQEAKADYKLDDFFFIPMLDARRMEVYAGVYNSNYACVQEVNAIILEEDTFSGFLNEKSVLFFGSGAEKYKNVVSHKNARFYSAYIHSSRYMIHLAESKLKNNQTENVAYFEPFYLKDFVTTTPKKNVLFGKSE